MKNIKNMTFAELAVVVWSIWKEVKRRNPIFVNFYEGPFVNASNNLIEIGKAEKSNPSCECGPEYEKAKLKYRTHWAKLAGDAYCGGPLSMNTTRDKRKVSCLTCRKLMKIHGHLGEQ